MRPKRILGIVLGVWWIALAASVSSTPSQDNRVRCANLVYAVNKSSVCFSDRFLRRIQSETRIEVDPVFSRVHLGDINSLLRYPFAIMTGEGGFTLTDQERVNLRYYVMNGGFLVASAGCSSLDWGRSFRREFARVFPDKRLEPLPLSHPVFRTVYAVKSLRTSHRTAKVPAVLEGMTVNGKLALVFSADGLNDTANAKNCCCCGGNEIVQAEFLNVNLLAYALLH